MNAAKSDIILERMMALHPKIIDLTLDRVWRLLAALDNPQDRLPPVIHLAGTNGKGSTQAMIRAGLEALIDRKSYYRLVEIGAVEEVDGVEMFGLWSSGEFFPMIPAAELEI